MYYLRPTYMWFLIFDANGEASIDMTMREIATVVIVKFIFNSIQLFFNLITGIRI